MAEPSLRKLLQNQTNSATAAELGQPDDGDFTSPPPKANAAPKPQNKTPVTGLMDALNAQEEQLVKDGVFSVANTYSIEFAPPKLGDSKVTKSGTPNKLKTPMQQSKSASEQKDPATNSADYNTRTLSYAAGTPIVAIIDEVLKNSSYISDQARVVVDEITQKPKPQAPLGNLSWYKIGLVATPKTWDIKRRDYAYNIKFIVSVYALSDMKSDYFPDIPYRGPHKSYKYWFTGENTQVLNVELNFNSLWKLVMSNPKILTDTQKETNTREIASRSYQAASAASTNQGAEGRANEINANAADYLYSPADLANIHMKIVGDPAWIQQGEIATGLSSSKFNFKPFNDDGTINFDSGQINFDFQWNRGVDYDVLGTGTQDPQAAQPGINQEIYSYTAVTVTSRFSKGKFEQDLVGKLLRVPLPNSAAATANTPDARRATNTAPAGTTARTPIVYQTKAAQAADPEGTGNASDPEAQIFIESYNASPPSAKPYINTDDYGDPESYLFQSVAPAAPAQPPTSSGQDVGTTAVVDRNGIPASPGAIPVATPQKSFTPEQQEIVALRAQASLAAKRGNLAELARLNRQLAQAELKQLKNNPPTPGTTGQTTAKEY